jgi:hypothetical protein
MYSVYLAFTVIQPARPVVTFSLPIQWRFLVRLLNKVDKHNKQRQSTERAQGQQRRRAVRDELRPQVGLGFVYGIRDDDEDSTGRRAAVALLRPSPVTTSSLNNKDPPAIFCLPDGHFNELIQVAVDSGLREVPSNKDHRR